MYIFVQILRVRVSGGYEEESIGIPFPGYSHDKNLNDEEGNTRLRTHNPLNFILSTVPSDSDSVLWAKM